MSVGIEILPTCLSDIQLFGISKQEKNYVSFIVVRHHQLLIYSGISYGARLTFKDADASQIQDEIEQDYSPLDAISIDL
jgi:hypothetical protein